LLTPIIINFWSDRKKPPYGKLQAIEDPERFVWHILPHAARTFSLSIVFLPRRMRLALAVAYLYCRMLDTYEDLLPGAAAKEEALRRFIDRFADTDALGPAPQLDPALSDDPRERTHLLLVNRAHLVDRVFAELEPSHQEAIRRLVRRMGEGMVWASRIFAEQGGVLRSPGQLSRYCWHVLGTPLLFAEEVQRLDQGLSVEVSEARLRSCALVGEVVQLANITRDLEKDCDRGIFYHPDLPAADGAERARRIQEVRAQLVLRALRLAAELRPFVESIPGPRVSLARGGAVMMVVTTYAYYLRASKKADLPAFREGERLTRLGAAFSWGRCVLSAKATGLFLRRIEEQMQTAFLRCRPALSQAFVYDDGGFDVVRSGLVGHGDDTAT
jgi:phytoene/squalene synthetase